VINGTALYTGSSFVVPSLPLTDVTNTVLLMKSVTNATVVSDSSTYAKSIYKYISYLDGWTNSLSIKYFNTNPAINLVGFFILNGYLY